MMIASSSYLGRRTWLIAAILVGSASIAWIARPKLKDDAPQVSLEATVPKAFAQWRAIESSTIQVGLTETETDINQPYDQTVLRSYQDTQGHVINVAIAWGKRQRQEVKIHRPELCYPAQGLRVEKLTPTTFPITSLHSEAVTGNRMIALDRSGQKELVSYWIRIGHIYSSSAWATRKHILLEGLAGHVTDGVLVRVSQRVSNDQDERVVFSRLEKFAAELVKATPENTKALLIK